MTVTLEQVKSEAISMVEDSMSRNCMFSTSTMPEEDKHDWSLGDPENPHTIANLVTSCGKVEGFNDDHEALEAVEEHILDKFPQFI